MIYTHSEYEHVSLIWNHEQRTRTFSMAISVENETKKT